MPEPEIPNLLDSLRTARRARLGPGRGRGRGRGGPPGSSSISNDAVIQGTDTDAAVSRLSAVQMGYLDDPYASFFVTNVDGPAPRRLPIINRGTYTRTTALDILIDSFLEDVSLKEKQIVSLGAGTDTRPFRLFDEQSRTRLIYHELDFETTCRKKLHIVQTRPQVKKILGEVSAEDDSSSWSSKPAAGGEYYCHGLDLRSLCVTKTAPEPPKVPGPELEPPEPADAPPPPVVLPGLRTDIPTLLLSECCLCYLSPMDASDVLAYFTSRIPNLATVIYEPIRPSDAFGQMMVSNLAARRIRMPTLSVYREAADQVARLRHAGFEAVENMTIEGIWQSWVEPEEKRRLDILEGLDEVEEWELLAGHYIVVWGSRGDGFARWESLGKKG